MKSCHLHAFQQMHVQCQQAPQRDAKPTAWFCQSLPSVSAIQICIMSYGPGGGGACAPVASLWQVTVSCAPGGGSLPSRAYFHGALQLRACFSGHGHDAASSQHAGHRPGRLPSQLQDHGSPCLQLCITRQALLASLYCLRRQVQSIPALPQLRCARRSYTVTK